MDELFGRIYEHKEIAVALVSKSFVYFVLFVIFFSIYFLLLIKSKVLSFILKELAIRSLHAKLAVSRQIWKLLTLEDQKELAAFDADKL